MKEEPIRVAQVVGKWVGGGVESVLMNYCTHINDKEVQFDFICDEDSTDIPYDKIESIGGRVILVPPYQNIFEYQKELTKVFAEEKYEIVHSHINALSVFPLYAAKKANVPVRIAHSHSTSSKKEWKRNLVKNMLRPFSKVFATDYMCCSEHAGRWLFGDKKYDEGNVYLLNNAIDVDYFKYNEEVRKNKREELNIPDDIKVIGHVGRFVSQKNHEFLIDIFNEVHKKDKKTILVLIGQGPLMGDIKKKVNELGISDCVKFLGQRKDINELYQALDLFLFPSIYEGIGMVLVEAQGSGLPCIASTEVPTYAKVSDLVDFLDLDLGEKVWSKKVLEILNNSKARSVSKENFEDRGYDINLESMKLIDKYKALDKQNNRKMKYRRKKK